MLEKLITAALLVFVVASVTGCVNMDAAQSYVAHNGAKAADDVRETAEWTLCNGITVGAWRRAYANDPAKAVAWADLCGVAK